jgi:hypothetical protein
MDDATIIDFTGRDAVTDPLTDLLRKVSWFSVNRSFPVHS